MRVAYVCSDAGVPVYGTKGASVHVRELCRAFAELGHEVVVLAARRGSRRPAGFDIPVRELTPDALGTFRPDAVYERYALFGTAGLTLARELGVPFALEVNAPLSDEQAAYRRLERPGEARELERRVLQAADRVIAVSPEVARWAAERGATRIMVVANGVDVDRFERAAGERERVRAELRLNGEPAAGFLGTLKPWHDTRALVRAAALLRRSGRRVRLVVIGDGPEREALETLASETGVEATFTGAVPHERVPELLSALDVAVAPYRDEPGFYFSPLKLFEYLAAGRPVVAADVGDLSHCVRPGISGWLYRAGDDGALAAGIAAVLSDSRRADAFGRIGREHVRGHHTWKRNAEVVLDAIGQTRGRSRAS